MLKIKRIVLVVAFLLILTGCGKTSTYDLKLEGSSNSYYNWTYKIADESIIKINSEKYYGSENSDDINGLGGTYEFELQALQMGKTEIEFSYMRTWDEKEKLYNYTVEFQVDKDLKIKKISESGNYLDLIKLVNLDQEKLGIKGELSDYKMVFTNEKIDIQKDKCQKLVVYDYNDKEISSFGISISNDNVYKIDGDDVTLIK